MVFSSRYPLWRKAAFDGKRLSVKRFTLIEIMMVLAICVILAAIIYPQYHLYKQRAKFYRWLAFNKGCSADADCVVNFNFQEGKGMVLNSTAVGCDWVSRDGLHTFNALNYQGLFKKKGGGVSELKWSNGGRFGRYKKAVQWGAGGGTSFVEVAPIPAGFPTAGTWSSLPGLTQPAATVIKQFESTGLTAAADFTPDQSFTILVWVKFDSFGFGDIVFSKATWGNPSNDPNDAAQYDLYCDPNKSVATGEGAFEVDVFCSCVGWGAKDWSFKEKGWTHVVLRYVGTSSVSTQSTTSISSGDIAIFCNGQKLGEYRKASDQSTTAKYAQANSNLLLGATGLTTLRNSSGIGYFLKGKIDEFMLYKRALSDGEIKGHYEMGKE